MFSFMNRGVISLSPSNTLRRTPVTTAWNSLGLSICLQCREKVAWLTNWISLSLVLLSLSLSLSLSLPRSLATRHYLGDVLSCFHNDDVARNTSEICRRRERVRVSERARGREREKESPSRERRKREDQAREK